MGFYLHDKNEFEDLLKANSRFDLKVNQMSDMLNTADPMQILENYSKYQQEMPEIGSPDAMSLAQLNVPTNYESSRAIAQASANKRIYDEARLWTELQAEFGDDSIADNMKMTAADVWTLGFAPGGAKPFQTQAGVWAFAGLDWLFQTLGPGGSGKWSVGSQAINAMLPGQPMAVGRSVAYLRDLREYDKLLKNGYSKVQAQRKLSIDLSGTRIQGLGENLGPVEEIKQQIDMIAEAHKMGGEPVITSMYRAVLEGKPINFDRSRWFITESVKAEKSPHYIKLTQDYGMSPDDARDFIYKNIGTPLRGSFDPKTGKTNYAFDGEGGNLYYTSFDNPNKINFYAGRHRQKYFYAGIDRQDYFRPEWANKDILMEYSPGKVQSAEFFEPGTTAFKNMSGLIDAAHQIVPEIFLGKGIKGVRNVSRGLRSVNGAYEMVNQGKLVKRGLVKNYIVTPRKLADNILEEVGPRIDGAVGTGKIDDLVDSGYQLLTNKNITADTANQRKWLKKMRKEETLFGYVPRFFQLTQDEILNQPINIRFFKAVAEEDNLMIMGSNNIIKDMPAQVQKALVEADDWKDVQNIFSQMIDTGYKIQNKYGEMVPYTLPGKTLPKTGSMVLNRMLQKTGIDRSYRTFGSFAGENIRKVKDTVMPFMPFRRNPSKLTRVENTDAVVIDKAEDIANKISELAKTENSPMIYKFQEMRQRKLPEFEKYLGFSSNYNSTYNPYYRKLLSVVPEMGIPLNNLDSGYRQLMGHLQVNQYDDIEANKILKEFLDIDPNQKFKYRDFAHQQALRDVKMIKSRGGNWEYVASVADEMFEGMQKSKIYATDKNGQMLPSIGTNYKGQEINHVGNAVDEFGQVTTNVTASMLSEMQDNIAPLLDYRLIERALGPLFKAYPEGQYVRTSFLGDVKAYGKYKSQNKWWGKTGDDLPNPFDDGILNVKRLEDNFLSNTLQFYTRNIFKPLVLMRFAFFTRVFMEEQARMAMKGISNVYSKPYEYLTWLASHNPNSKVGSILENLPFTKNYQKAKYSDDAVNFLMEEEIMEAMQKSMRYEDITGTSIKARNRHTEYVAKRTEELNQDEINLAVYHELRLLKGDEINQAVARYGYGSNELAEWIVSDAGKKARLELVRYGGAGHADLIDETSRALDQHLQYIESRIRKIAGGDLDLALDAVKNKNGRYTYALRSDVNVGESSIRNLIAEGKLLRKGKTGTKSSDYVDFMSNEKFFKKYDKNKMMNELGYWYSKEDGINPGVLNKVRDVNPSEGVNNYLGTVEEMMDHFFDTVFTKLMTKPIGVLNRSTTFKQFRWMYISERFKDMDKSVRAKFIKEGIEAGIPKNVIQELKGQNSLYKSGPIKDFQVMDIESKAYGLAGVKELLYDTRKRHTVSDKLVNVFPFIEVWFEVFQTWGQLLAEKPYALRQAQVSTRGLGAANTLGESSDDGFISPDPMNPDKDVFVYPFGGFMSNLIFDDEMFSDSDRKVQMSPKASLQGVNLLAQGFVPGPNSMVAFGLSKLIPKAESATSAVGIKSGWGNELETFIFGEFPPPEKISDAFRESPVYRKLGAAMLDEDEFERITDGSGQLARMRAKSTIELFRWGVAAGESQRLYKAGKLDKYIPQLYPEFDKNELNKGQIDNLYLEYAKEKSGTLFAFQFIYQFFGPAGFKPEFFIEDDQGQMWGQAVLYEEYVRIREQEGGNDLRTYTAFFEEFGVEHPYLLSPRTQAEGGKQNYSVRVQNFQKDNSEMFANLEVSGYYLNIDNPYEEKNYRDILDYKNELSPDQYRRAINDTIGFFRYKKYSQKVDNFEYMDSTRKTILKRHYRNELKLALPGFQSEEYGMVNPPSVNDIFDEMKERWLPNQAIMGTEVGKGFGEIMKYWTIAESLSMQYNTSGNPDWWLTSSDPKAKMLRVYVYNGANEIMEQYPEFWGVWNGVLVKLYRDDQEVLDYFER